MSVIQIYADSKGRGTCRSCGADVEWAETIRGKRMPFNPPIVAMRSQGSILEGDGRVIEDVDTTVTASHFATCPDADKWRRKG
jgi:hypothetical protein